jgi:hypothetical protein
MQHQGMIICMFKANDFFLHLVILCPNCDVNKMFKSLTLGMSFFNILCILIWWLLKLPHKLANDNIDNGLIYYSI